MPIDDFIDAFTAMLKKLTIHDLTAKLQARFVQETKENLKEASTNQGIECSMPAAHLKPKRQPITNEMLGQMLSQLDMDHKPSHDRLAAITLGFFGLLRDNTTPLYVASQNGHHDVVQTLLGAGADVNIARSDEALPFAIALANLKKSHLHSDLVIAWPSYLLQ
ncbi:hypothetical protein EMCRGX_G005034 [Ephydatia muelleri]